MKTVKLKIMNQINIGPELRIFNSVLHYAYNRFHENPSIKEKEVRAKVNELFKGKINSWLIQCAIKDGYAIQAARGTDKVIFGGKNLYRRYLKGLIDKDTFINQRYVPISSQGEMLPHGNRMFTFDFENQKLTFKISRYKHVEIHLGKIHRKLQKELNKLGELCANRQATVSVKLNNEYIWLTYDEKLVHSSLQFKGLMKTRVMGIDLNPNYIGLSVLKFDSRDEFRVLHKQVFDLTQLTSKNITDDKRNYELIQICHQIKNLIGCWKCGSLVLEELNIKSSDKGCGRGLNRLCNNVWDRNLIVNKLKMLGNIYGYKLVEVNPAYSSFIGNISHGDENTPDMIAASIEIARRGYKKYEKNWFYPKFNIESLDEQWKQTLAGVKDWKNAFLEIKNSKVKYRVLLTDTVQNAVFSNFNTKSKIVLYCFG